MNLSLINCIHVLPIPACVVEDGKVIAAAPVLGGKVSEGAPLQYILPEYRPSPGTQPAIWASPEGRRAVMAEGTELGPGLWLLLLYPETVQGNPGWQPEVRQPKTAFEALDQARTMAETERDSNFKRSGSEAERDVALAGRLAVETALHDAEAMRDRAVAEYDKIQGIIDGISDVVYALDTELRYIHVNQACRMFMPQPPGVGLSVLDFLPVEGGEEILDQLRRVLRGETVTAEMRMEFKPNPPVYLLTTKSPIYNGEGQVVGIVGVAKDITRKKEIENELLNLNEELSEQQEELRQSFDELLAAQEQILHTKKALRAEANRRHALFDRLPVAVKLMDGMVMVEVNDAFLYLFGLTPEDRDKVVGTTPLDWSPEYQLNGKRSEDFLRELLAAAVETKDVTFLWQHQRPDGTKFEVETFLYGFEMDGKLYMQAAMTDVTEKLRMHREIHCKNEELETQQEELRSNLENLEALNHALVETQHKLQHTLDDLMEAQTQLVHAEKMSSLGQLTAGLAHEINNPVNFIHGGIQALNRLMNSTMEVFDAYEQLLECPTAEAYREQLERVRELRKATRIDGVRPRLAELVAQIQMGSSRTAEIVRGLRNFSRIDEAELKTADLHEGLENTLLLLSSRLKIGIEVAREYDKTLPPVECYAGQLNQVFMNLLNNAVQAIEQRPGGPRGGNIVVSTCFLPESQRVRISVGDNGVGMETATLQRIFEPFFTTKATGQGMGLGLSISYGIVEKHGGKILVESSPGQGSTFQITLPVHQPRNAEA